MFFHSFSFNILHKRISKGAAHKALTWQRGQQKQKYLQVKEYKVVYLTSVCAVLVAAKDFGSRIAMSFFEKALALFMKVVH
jgi:hypothetical protein